MSKPSPPLSTDSSMVDDAVNKENKFRKLLTTLLKTLAYDLVVLAILVVAGGLLVFAFAPFHLFWLAFICPAIFLWSCTRAIHFLQVFMRGLAFGLGFYGGGVYWVYISLHQFGGASTILAGCLAALLIIFLSLFTATLAMAVKFLLRYRGLGVVALAGFPVLWVIWEYLRELPFNGFPWLFLGYSQVGTPLKAYAPYIGVYGISLVIGMISGCLLLLVMHPVIRVKLFSLLVVGILFAGSGLLSFPQWTVPQTPSIKISLVQGNVAQSLKWDPEQLIRTLRKYWQLTQDLSSSQLIIWPEAAVPILPEQVNDYINHLTQFTLQHQNHLIFGTLLTNTKQQFFNGLISIGSHPGKYAKRHLVPFGEYTPLGFIFNPIMEKMHIPMSDFTSGATQQPLIKVDHILISPFICYEIAFSHEVLAASKNSNLLIVLSDDSWFGQSIALAQHLQISQMRAIETGRPLLTVTNTGITAVVSPQGKILDKVPVDKAVVLTKNVMPMRGLTPLMWWDYYPLLMIMGLLLCFVVIVHEPRGRLLKPKFYS